eukprot:3731455-Ditylum_brightwellii.AAC.1
MVLVLSPQDSLKQGLQFNNQIYPKASKEIQLTKFQQHFGSLPIDLLEQWYDIQTTILPEPNHDGCPEKVKEWAIVKEKEKS